MKFSELILNFEKIYPKDLCENWDNAGLMLGNPEKVIKKAVVVLDVTQTAIDFAIENDCDLIFTHHPFIMSGLKSLDLSSKKGEFIQKLIKNDICVYSAHTNFDTAENGVNDALCELLEAKVTDNSAMVRKAQLKSEITLKEFIEKVKQILSVPYVTVTGDLDIKIKNIGVCGGGGGCFIADCNDCDVLLTGEAKYHEYQNAYESGLAVVSAGHFETENVTLYKIRQLLSDMKITVLDGDIHKSFCKIV